MPLYVKIKTPGKGNSECELNRRAGQFLSTHKDAIPALVALFSLLDTHSPTPKTLLKHTHKACDVIESLGKTQLQKNQSAVAELMQHNPDQQELIIAGDTVYNCTGMLKFRIRYFFSPYSKF